MDNLNTKFIKEIPNITNPTIFLGLAHLLRVKIVEEEKNEEGHFEARSFEDICVDVIEAYAHSTRRRKREILKLLREANCGGEENADRTEDSKTSISN